MKTDNTKKREQPGEGTKGVEDETAEDSGFRKWTWRAGDVEWEKRPAPPGTPPVIAPEHVELARKQLAESKKSG